MTAEIISLATWQPPPLRSADKRQSLETRACRWRKAKFVAEFYEALYRLGEAARWVDLPEADRVTVSRDELARALDLLHASRAALMLTPSPNGTALAQKRAALKRGNAAIGYADPAEVARVIGEDERYIVGRLVGRLVPRNSR